MTDMTDTTITFSDGTILTAENNGSCYITDTKPAFPEDFSAVTVSVNDGDYVRERTYQHAEIIECASVDGRYWFAFREPSPEELRQKELNDTIQMLTDCLLEMSELIYS